MPTAYPLQWPDVWARTKHRRSAPYFMTLDRAYDSLQRELKLLGAMKGSIVVSSNVSPRNAFGTPRKDGATVDDPGVAVYWTDTKHGERVVACDRWTTVRGNVRAIGIAIESLRAIDRAGATQIYERAFTAFGALPPAQDAAKVRPWWEVLGFTEAVLGVLSPALIDARWRELAHKAHPDRGGSDAEMAELNRAREDGRRHYGG
jgi:hypothetical protein